MVNAVGFVALLRTTRDATGNKEMQLPNGTKVELYPDTNGRTRRTRFLAKALKLTLTDMHPTKLFRADYATGVIMHGKTEVVKLQFNNQHDTPLIKPNLASEWLPDLEELATKFRDKLELPKVPRYE